MDMTPYQLDMMNRVVDVLFEGAVAFRDSQLLLLEAMEKAKECAQVKLDDAVSRARQ